MAAPKLPPGVKFLPGPSAVPERSTAAVSKPAPTDPFPTPTGKLALPKSPFDPSRLTAPAAPPVDARHQQLTELNARINAERAQIGAPKVTPGHSKVGEFVGEAIAGASNPIMLGEGAISGAKQLGHGVKEAAQGNLGGGAADVGLGALGVAGILPLGRGSKVLTEGVDALRAGRTGEEALAHVNEASAAARTQGYGAAQAVGGKGRVPLVPEGAVGGEETAGAVGQHVRQGLTGSEAGAYEKAGAAAGGSSVSASEARKIQEAARAPERAVKARAAGAAMEQGGREGLAASRSATAGKYTATPFEGLKNLTPDQVDNAINHILEHPSLSHWEKLRAGDALEAAVDNGKLPTASEEGLLQRAFGTDYATGIVNAAKAGHKGTIVSNVLALPRSLKASTDLSSPFRQSLVVGLTHPVIFAKAFKPMMQSLGSEEGYAAMMDEIRGRNTYPLMEKSALPLTNIGPRRAAFKDGLTKYAATKREETFYSNYAEAIPGAGRWIRKSERAFVGFQNRVRADMFDQLVSQAAKQGHDLHDQHLIESISKVIGSATGRGSLGALQKHVVTLNSFFFAPRLIASRVNYLNPLYYKSLDPFARREALKGLFGLAGLATTVLGIAKAGGLDFSTDPTSADFAKIKVGNERIDLLAGFSQYARFAYQMVSGLRTSTLTGQTSHLGPGFGNTSRFDLFVRFLQGKASPVPAMVSDVLKGQDYTGKRVTWNDLSSYETEIANGFIPFVAKDMWDIAHVSGPGAAGASLLPDLFGIGVQDYKAKPSGGGGGGGSSYSYDGWSNDSSGGGGSSDWGSPSGGDASTGGW